MPGSQWPAWLLVGGLALIGIGVVVAIVVMTVVLVRRQRAVPTPDVRLAPEFEALGTGGSRRGASSVPERVESARDVSAVAAHRFVATPDSRSSPPSSAATRAGAAPHPIVEPGPPTELTSPPLANPWVGTGPQPARNSTETVPTMPVEHVPLAVPAGAPAAGEREDERRPFVAAPASPAAAEPGDDEDPTILLGGPKPAPWLLILDTGERIPIPADSVVLGRKPAPIEHGLPGVVIPDPTKTVSKVHARLDRSGEHWSITDLGSTNGCSIIDAAGREKLLPSGGSGELRGRFLLGEVGMILVPNPEGPER